MSFFTWKDTGLTSDCASLDAMASRFEETANLMKKLSQRGFKLKKTQRLKDNLFQDFLQILLQIDSFWRYLVEYV